MCPHTRHIPLLNPSISISIEKDKGDEIKRDKLLAFPVGDDVRRCDRYYLGLGDLQPMKSEPQHPKWKRALLLAWTPGGAPHLATFISPLS
jgi:hypothetical protein